MPAAGRRQQQLKHRSRTNVLASHPLVVVGHGVNFLSALEQGLPSRCVAGAERGCRIGMAVGGGYVPIGANAADNELRKVNDEQQKLRVVKNSGEALPLRSHALLREQLLQLIVQYLTTKYQGSAR